MCEKRPFMFIGREEELKILRKMITQNSPGVGVLYGRRRIGKSALIREAFIQNEKILFFEGLEDQSQSAQMANFIFQLKKQISIEMPNPPPKTWRECLDLLTPILKKIGTSLFSMNFNGWPITGIRWFLILK